MVEQPGSRPHGTLYQRWAGPSRLEQERKIRFHLVLPLLFLEFSLTAELTAIRATFSNPWSPELWILGFTTGRCRESPFASSAQVK